MILWRCVIVGRGKNDWKCLLRLSGEERMFSGDVTKWSYAEGN